jgi:hypothetical protein
MVFLILNHFRDLHLSPNATLRASSAVSSGLRVYKELLPMKKEQLDVPKAIFWIPDSKTPNGVAEVRLTS